MSNIYWPRFSGATLAEIYSRLRDEQGDTAMCLDPNEKSRARIAMCILVAAELGSADPKSLEVTARALLQSEFMWPFQVA
jgi:hypothetical protein